jgi:hypothetical protein
VGRLNFVIPLMFEFLEIGITHLRMKYEEIVHLTFNFLCLHRSDKDLADTTIDSACGASLYSDEISGRILMSKSSYSITQKEYLKAIYRN